MKYRYIKKLLKLLKKLGLENKPVFCNIDIVESSKLEGLTVINGNIVVAKALGKKIKFESKQWAIRPKE